MLRRALWVIGGGLIGLVACAEGTGIEDGSDGVGGEDVTDGSGGEGPATTAQTTAAQTTTSGQGGDPGEGGAGTTTSSTTTGQVCDFMSLNECANAEIMSPIAGDEAGPTVTKTGSASRWFKIRIEEQVSSISSADLSYRVTLASPAGMDFSLTVYEGDDSGPADCNAAPIVGSGTPETVNRGWNDSQGIGGEDNSRWVIIEVQHVSGTACGPSDKWTLTVQGNT